VLTRLIEAAEARDLRPKSDPSDSLIYLIDQSDAQLKVCALKLAGLWQVKQTQGKVLAAAKDESLPIATRAAAFGAIAKMKLPMALELLSKFAAKPHADALRAAAIQACVEVDVRAAARLAVELFGTAELDSVVAAQCLSAFLNRKEDVDALANAIPSGKLNADSAKSMLRSLYSTGRSDNALLVALNSAIGDLIRAPEYSQAYVANLAADSRNKGDATRGALMFKSLACASCHKVSGSGGEVGPDLTAIGTTLSTDRIIEELLWPNRQVKEGYTTLQVITVAGQIHQGYERRTRESEKSGDVVIQDLSTQRLLTIDKQDIELVKKAGSPMPEGLTSVISPSQLLDLIQYLSELGKIR
jgi:putative heme-binding domain-containing protein